MPDLRTEAIDSSASFSDCGKYRFYLHRDYGSLHKCRTLNFIMLNPSTATAEHNDPTIARCEKKALYWNYRHMIITNLFAYRATDPKEMLNRADPIGERNTETIIKIAKHSDMVICAWGSHGKHLDRHNTMKHILKLNGIKAFALRMNKDHTPAHPLYLPDNLKLVPFT